MPLISWNHADLDLIYNSGNWTVRHIVCGDQSNQVLEWLDTHTNGTVLLSRNLASLLELKNPMYELRFQDLSDVVFFDLSELGRLS